MFKTKYQYGSIQTNAIIQGAPIDSQLVENANAYVDADELQSVANLASNNKGISAYWLTALLNFYG